MNLLTYLGKVYILKSITKDMIKQNIKNTLEENKKERISITLSRKLLTRLNKFKENAEIDALSPLIEIIIMDWLDNQQEMENGDPGYDPDYTNKNKSKVKNS